MSDVRLVHRRRLIRPCPCGRRHTRDQVLYLRDQRAREIHAGGELGAIISGWRTHQKPFESWPLSREWGR